MKWRPGDDKNRFLSLSKRGKLRVYVNTRANQHQCRPIRRDTGAKKINTALLAQQSVYSYRNTTSFSLPLACLSIFASCVLVRVPGP